MRVVFIACCLIGGAIAAYFGQPLARNNADVTLIIITVLTVFAGFLVAIIAVLGDPAMIPDGNWRISEVRRSTIEARLITHVWLFTAYLIAIVFLFAGALISKAQPCTISDTLRVWIERLYLFTGISSFLLTFALPRMLLKLQLGRIDAETRRRRKMAHIKDDGT